MVGRRRDAICDVWGAKEDAGNLAVRRAPPRACCSQRHISFPLSWAADVSFIIIMPPRTPPDSFVLKHTHTHTPGLLARKAILEKRADRDEKWEHGCNGGQQTRASPASKLASAWHRVCRSKQLLSLKLAPAKIKDGSEHLSSPQGCFFWSEATCDMSKNFAAVCASSTFSFIFLRPFLTRHGWPVTVVK